MVELKLLIERYGLMLGTVSIGRGEYNLKLEAIIQRFYFLQLLMLCPVPPQQ